MLSHGFSMSADGLCLFLAACVMCVDLWCGVCRWQGCHACQCQMYYLYFESFMYYLSRNTGSRKCVCVCVTGWCYAAGQEEQECLSLWGFGRTYQSALAVWARLALVPNLSGGRRVELKRWDVTSAGCGRGVTVAKFLFHIPHCCHV